MIDQLLQYDAELFLYLNNLGTPTWDAFWMAYTTKFNWIPFYALLVYLLYKQSDLKSFFLTCVMLGLLVLFTDQITNLFKYGFERPRPCHIDELLQNMRLVRTGCGGRYGFFSGHSSNSMGVAFFIGLMLRHRFRYLIYLLIFWAMLMGFSRVYVGVHYPLDVLCGMIFGSLGGFLLYKLNRYLNKKLIIIPSKPKEDH
ncbi:undecaprenyl-diphosphatase [Flavobacteriaceae bacterium MAR_2010_188]|nr:undecaprenyl-diphosphatase [Flavobacteriaceae bacterium MAR_2010_188]